MDKRLTPQRNRLLLISNHLIGTTAISLPTLFEGGRLLDLKLKGFAAAGPDAQFTKCYILTLPGDSGIILGNAKLGRIMEITG